MSDELDPNNDTSRFATPRGLQSGGPRKWLRASVVALALALPLVVYCCCKAIRREPGLEVITIPSGRAPAVRVLLTDLVDGAGSATIASRGPCVVEAGTPLKRKRNLPRLSATRVESTDGQVSVSGLALKGEVVAFKPKKDGDLIINKRQYRGWVLLRVRRGVLQIINTVNVEGYLAGVIGEEMPSSWPKAALEAQAIAARTYVVYEICRRMGEAAYDVVDSTASQVYGGVNAETSSTINAVKATRGLILTYHGKVLKAYFHSACGGHTTSAARVWGGADIPPLAGVQCDYCRDSKYYRWKPAPGFTQTEVRKALAEGGVSIGSIRDIRTVDVDASGRARVLVVKGSTGQASIPPDRFRKLLGTRRLRSTAFEVKKTARGFTFNGRGFGHGVGMCQYGALGLSRRGLAGEEIVRYYYPRAEVMKWY